MNLTKFSETNWHRMNTAYAPPHSEIGLVLCIQEEIGELAASVLGWSGEKKRKAHLTKADTADAIADAVTYLDLLCTKIGYNLETILQETFNEVSKRTGYERQI